MRNHPSALLALLVGCTPPSPALSTAPFTLGAATADLQEGPLRLSVGGDATTLRLFGSSAAAPVEAPCPHRPEEACVRTEAGPVDTWWRQTGEGLEAIYVAHEATGEETLQVDLDLDGARASYDGPGSLSWALGAHTVRYAGLVAWDATGRPLGARMRPSASGLRISVDVAEATFPVTIDPLLTVPDQRISPWSGEARARLPHGAGDTDGDGHDDLIIGQIGTLSPWSASTSGLAWFAGGGPMLPERPDRFLSTGLAFISRLERVGDMDGDGRMETVLQRNTSTYDDLSMWLIRGAPAWGTQAQELRYPFPGAWHGVDAAGGDVDGDGRADLVVLYLGSDGVQERWELQVHLGGGPVSARRPDVVIPLSENVTQVSPAGDVNGDGYDDILVGDPIRDGTFVQNGRISLHLGSVAGLSPTPSWTVEGDRPYHRLGAELSPGDVNGDGYDDVLLGSWFSGTTGLGTLNNSGMWIHHGGPAGPSATPDWGWTDPTSPARAYPAGAVGDMDGDGADEVAYGTAPVNDWTTWVHRGGPTGVETTAWLQIPGGPHVAGVGDVDADGLDDLGVGSDDAMGYDENGRVDIVHGMVDPAGDSDGDGATDATDCADQDPARHPGATELWSDGLDQDCDGWDRVFPLEKRVLAVPGATVLFHGQGDAAGAVVTVLATTTGLGAGPCMPADPSICLGILAPRLISTTTVVGSPGLRTWTITVPIPPDMPYLVHTWYQAVLMAPNGTVAVSTLSHDIVPGP